LKLFLSCHFTYATIKKYHPAYLYSIFIMPIKFYSCVTSNFLPLFYSWKNTILSLFSLLTFPLNKLDSLQIKKEHLSYLRRRRSVQLNLVEKQLADNFFPFSGGFKNALSENNLHQDKNSYRPPSPKLCNFMREFEHGSMPNKIHVI